MSDFSLYKYAEKFAHSYHKKRSEQFKGNSLDNNDLAQEAILYLVQFIRDIRAGKFEGYSRKTKIPRDLSGEDLRKLIGQALFFRFCVIRRACERYNKLFESLVHNDSTDELHINMLQTDEMLFSFFELKQLLNEDDFKILYKKFKENKTFQEIGKDFGFSKQYIKQKFDKIITELKVTIKEIFL